MAFGDHRAVATIERALSRVLEGKPKRLFPSFDMSQQGDILEAAGQLYRQHEDVLSAINVSVIMPTFNRADRISAAIRSVQAQSHENFELLIIDDGSDDDTASVLKEFENDPRIRVFWNDHLGVSAARNTGLENATGQYVFYLDSDNTWTPEFVATMIVAFQISGKSCLYGASELQSASGITQGYRGEPFNWQHCLSGNYVDMNVFCHHADLIDRIGKFDVDLARMVDWDLILRYTKAAGAAYCPVIGCIYFDDANDKGRITTSKPYIYRKIVHEKNKQGLSTAEETFANISLSFCIKIPAPYEVRNAWGDYHYARSLEASLKALGHTVRIDFLEEWNKHPRNSTDITIVLRGLSRYEPHPSELSILWNISHPDQISYEEYESYKIVCVASSSYSKLLATILGREVKTLMQCVDSKLFAYRGYENDPAKPGVFVGNSRNEYRDIVKWAGDAGLDLAVYGQGWENYLPDGKVKKYNIPNDQLADVYARGQFVLNDHWASMKDFGIVSNRVFDVVGCGGRLISDGIASINDICDGAVEIVDGPKSLAGTVARLPPVSQAHRAAVASKIHAHHSFDARACEILAFVRETLMRPGSTPEQSKPSADQGPRRKRVGLLLQQGRAWPTSSAFIRLIAPLTTDYADRELEIILLEGVDDAKLDGCDICIVQRIAVSTRKEGTQLREKLRKLGVPLYIDTDDAFHLHDQHREEDAVLRELMEIAQETWFSTENLKNQYADVQGTKRVFLNSLDPRYWRNYRKPVSTAFTDEKIRFVYMGTATHDSDFSEVLPAFESLAEQYRGKFELNLIGAVRTPPKKSWINIIAPPASMGSYPKFVRWLVANNRFDVGIAPLSDSAFNCAKSDIKSLDYAALGLLPLVSDCPAYRNAIDIGMAIGCKPGEWFDRMAEIIRAPDAFEARRERVLENVWEARNTLRTSKALVDVIMEPFRQAR